MTYVISVSAQKGGCGKSTSAVSIVSALTRQGKSVLLVDCDSQGNATIMCGIKKPPYTLYEVLKGRVDINSAIITVKSGYDVLPVDRRMSGADFKPHRIKSALEGLQTVYDFIILDCPPALDTVVIMALTASDFVLVPTQAQYLSFRGLISIMDSVEHIKRLYNKELRIIGILFNQFDPRRNLDVTIKNEVMKQYEDLVFKTTIPQNVSLAECAIYGKDIFAYAPESKGAKAYEQVTQELLRRL